MIKNEFIRILQQRASLQNARIAFPDAEDERTLIAAAELSSNVIARPILVGDIDKISKLSDKIGISANTFQIINPIASENFEKYAALFESKRKAKGITGDEARRIMADPLYFAGMMLAEGDADCCVAGSYSTTGNVLRAAILTVGLKPGNSVASSYFLMLLADGRVMAYSDCGVVPEPTAEQLADIAAATTDNFQKASGEVARVAFLSFSTKGSAKHPSAEKVRVAAELFRQRRPEIVSDGELQADAALAPDVARRKTPDSALRGSANVLIFPDLNSGNIAYKLTERLAGALAFGPIIQGLAKPYCDLSRGCSSDDIVNTAAIAAQML